MGIIMVNLLNGIDGERVGAYALLWKIGKTARLTIGRNFGQSEEIITAEINSFWKN